MNKKLIKKKRVYINRRVPLALYIVAMLPIAFSSNVYAKRFDTGVPDLQARWDNTLKYSALYRVEGLDEQVTGNSFSANFDDGDRNFDVGLVSNRLNLLSELDLQYRNIGFRISGSAWYDHAYQGRNDNDSPTTFNPESVSNDRFTQETEELHGQDAELLDTFLFGRTELFGAPISARLGRHTLLYGESLFFGGNGVANAQSSIDVVKALSVPGSQFKEIARPINQLSTSIQLTPEIGVGAYYQFEWREYRLPGSGSYFSTSDILDDGGERLLIGTDNTTAFHRGKDIEAEDSGQGGMQVRWKPDGSEFDFGFYAAKHHSKTPVIYLEPGAGSEGLGEYRLVYPEDIKTYGASVSTLVGDTNVALETSYRQDTPLMARGGAVVVNADADNSGNAAYPVGDSFHAQVSTVSVLPASTFWDGATLLSEIAFNRRLSISRNADQLDPNATRDAWGLRVLFEPQYFQVLPQLDLSVPINVGWAPVGRSSVFSFGPDNGGDITLGLNASYQGVYRAGLSWTHYYGDKGATLDEDGALSYKQNLGDRDFISLRLQRTF
ncbi:DUF1302 domain-containing protein [Marinobacter sp. GN3S48]|uniref:DUF1302 domain-containing protein n=1 Tax=Marinobacter sp. GN3S48 TaxID=3382302 RepID=UPI00387B371F